MSCRLSKDSKQNHLETLENHIPLNEIWLGMETNREKSMEWKI
jgi:hypothetical protein